MDYREVSIQAVIGPLSAAELRVFHLLLGSGGALSQVELAVALGLSDCAVNRACAALVAFGMLYRARDGRDVRYSIEQSSDKWTWSRHGKKAKSDMAKKLSQTWQKSYVSKMSKEVQVPENIGTKHAAYAAECASTEKVQTRDNIYNNKNSKKKKSLVRNPSDGAMHVAAAYHARVKGLYPSLTGRMDEKTDRSGALVLDELVRIDKHAPEYVRKVLKWALTDDFWSRNMLSLASARCKGKNGLTKFVNCASKMESAVKEAHDVVGPVTVSRTLTEDELKAVPNCLAGAI